MNERAVTGYATAPDGVSLVYQMSGVGPCNLVWLPSINYPFDLLWEEPSFARFARRLGSFTRTLWGGGRGLGASGGHFLDCFVEERMLDDVTSTLDSIGWGCSALVGHGMGSWAAVAYAAVHPDRVSSLILIDGYAHYVRESDYAIGIPPHLLDTAFMAMQELWGSGISVDLLSPSRAADPLFRDVIARCERFGQSPDEMAESVKQCLLNDVRGHLGSVAAPTLVLHRTGDPFIRPEASRYLADHIAGAKHVELPGNDHNFFVGDADGLLDEIEEFLTGSRQDAEGDVVMSAILFTDIVSSTEQAAQMGHRKWSALVDDHDAMVRATLARHRGREVKTIGDGFLATFDAATRAVRAATEIAGHATSLGLDVRAGIHTGEVEMRPNDVVGLAVNIAKRVCDLAGAGQVLVSEAVPPLVAGSGINFEPRGDHELKGVPGTWRLFAALS